MDVSHLHNAFYNTITFPVKTPVFHSFSLCNPLLLKTIRASNPPLNPNATGVPVDLQSETLRALEWKSVCLQLSAFTSTTMAMNLSINGNVPSGQNQEESEKLLDQTSASVELPNPLDFSNIQDLTEILNTSISGKLCTIQELCTVSQTLRSAKRVLNQLMEISSDGSLKRYSPLLDILHGTDFLPGIEGKIGFCLECNLSVILDRASTNLEKIRFARKKNMENLENLLKQISIRVSQAGGIDTPLVTRRRARMCVGIRATHRSLLPGAIILDTSGSGATYFVEPKEAIELNNMEVSLSGSEKAEELSILGILTSEIAAAKSRIGILMDRIMELDLASARGSYARSLNGVRPIFSRNLPKFIRVHGNEGIETFKKQNLTANTPEERDLAVDIEGIRHPLLLKSKDNNEEFEVVPVDIKVKKRTRVVVISGPNTGGKTATMKTLGLASLMSKAGMFLPAKNRAKLPWFDCVLADIGDHQSLEHNLSTFSGHISRLCKILEVASNESLVLIDEIGNGTDPSEGVVLSTSILQHLAGLTNLTVVTTHFEDLSILKDGDIRFENAAMEFDLKTLQPTYRIMWGSKGNSNALSIAKSLGLDQAVLDRAHAWVEKLMPEKQRKRKGLLYQSLMEQRERLEAQARKATFLSLQIKKLYHEILQEAEDLDKREASLKSMEVKKVQNEIKMAALEMDGIIMEVEKKLSNSSLDRFNSLHRESEAAIASVVEKHCARDKSLLETEPDHSNSYIPQIGDHVRIKGLGEKLAVVVEAPLDDGSMLIQYGKMRMRVKRDDIKVISGSKQNAKAASASGLRSQVIRKNMKESSTKPDKDGEVPFGPAVRTSKNTVDLRGLRVEEASHHLNIALSTTSSYGVLFIVHGIGTGVLKETVLNILRKHPRVVKFEQESPMNYGCTIAYIK
ncbi:uncharacterized protein LOC18423139 [Amborella trichopoda]|uniref:uncharacterized protein LOC18423139 n=1 Tax=Amborella trichopoda TaxID=13333 RepID=UPI0005D444AD|nr:uncharacterized protein LOC18423139 [Amborella trichopoda]|eukprot:XP_011625477.1 uncharacterized protein LOC18423139 [Amborella trichopoda]